MNNKITFSQLKSLVMEAKGSIDAEWKKYQANLKRIRSYYPRLKKLDVDGLVGKMKEVLSDDEYEDLFATYEDGADRVGFYWAEWWGINAEDVENGGIYNINYINDTEANGLGGVMLEYDGSIISNSPNCTLFGKPDNWAPQFLSKEKYIEDGGFLGKLIDDDAECSYKELFDAVQKLADGIGPYLDKVEKILDENGLKNLRVRKPKTDFVIKNGELLKYNGKGGDVVIPDGVTSIEEKAFWGCKGLTSITIPNSVTRIGDDAFHGCSGLASVVIPAGITSVIVPDLDTTLGWAAFEKCSSLVSVKFLNSNLFRHNVQDPDFAFKGTPWAEKIKSGNITFDNGLETNKETGTLDSYFGTDRSVSIPADVTTIGVGAFEGNRIIGTVTIPDTVAVISSNAFANCSGLTSITLGSGIKRIEKDAFKGVSEHITVYVPNFAMCELLIESGLPDSAIVMVGKGATRRRVALDPEEVRESEDYDEVEVDEPYRDCEITIHSVKGDREYGMKYYNKIKWFESRHDLVHWLHCGIAGTEGAEQDHYYSMLDQLEDGKTVVDYNYEW